MSNVKQLPNRTNMSNNKKKQRRKEDVPLPNREALIFIIADTRFFNKLSKSLLPQPPPSPMTFTRTTHTRVTNQFFPPTVVTTTLNVRASRSKIMIHLLISRKGRRTIRTTRTRARRRDALFVRPADKCAPCGTNTYTGSGQVGGRHAAAEPAS